MSLNKTQSGFSLPELLVAMGLLGGIVLVTMRLFDEQTSNEAYLKGRTEITKAVSLIKSALNDPYNCKSMVAAAIYDTGGTKSILGGGNWSPTGISSTSLAIPVKSSLSSGTVIYKELLKANTIYNGFQTKDFYLSKPVGTPDNIVEMELNFLMKSKSAKLWGAVGGTSNSERTISEKIRFRVTNTSLSSTSLKITDCGGVVSETNLMAAQKFCLGLGTAVTWTGTQCVWNAGNVTNVNCPWGKVVVKVNNLGSFSCDDIKKHINVYELFDTVSTCSMTTNRKFTITKNASGKLQVNCL